MKVTRDNKYSHQQLRVKAPGTGLPTTISIEHVTYIRLCQTLRSITTVNKLAVKFAKELAVDDMPLSTRVCDALVAHCAELKLAAGRSQCSIVKK